MSLFKEFNMRLAVVFLTGIFVIIQPELTQAQTEFPTKRITVIVPYAAGGIVDIATRIVSEKVSQRLGQPIVVEVKPGGNANLGTLLAAHAEPDGYTWSYIGPATLANPHIYSNLRWDTSNFVGVGVTAWAPFAIVVNPNSPANTIAEFIELAKKSPGVLNYANTGVGSAVHMNTAIFMQNTNTVMTMVPYTGQPQALLDLMADRTHFMVASLGLVTQLIQEKKLKALALIAHKRSPLLPEVQTIAELGYPAVNVVPWYGIAVQRNVPQPIVDKINATINAAMADPSIKTLFAAQSLEPVEPMNPKQIADLIAKDSQEVGRVVKAANIKLNQ
jgi:tripartite-type tricarboxylate transporter receptor subunit TctC